MGAITDLVRKLRQKETPEEKQLWQLIRNRKLNGKKFKRQEPIIYIERQYRKHFFVADFYCAEAKLIIELDGKIHDFQKDYDAERDLILRELNLKVLRIKNEELRNIEIVVGKIIKALE